MFKLLTIALLLAPVPAMAEEDWQAAIRRGAEDMDRRSEATRRELHDMNMESYAAQSNAEQHRRGMTQRGIRDQMILNGGTPYWR